MDTQHLLRESFAFGRDKLGGVAGTPLNAPTPCSEWTLRQLLNHTIVCTDTLVRAADGEEVDPALIQVNGAADVDFPGDDPGAAFEDVAARARRVFQAPGALDGMLPMPWGESPGQVVAHLVTADAVLHGWDVARATGQDATIPAPIAEAILAFAKPMIAEYGRGDNFAPEVEVGPDASASDRLVAFLGRRP